MTEAGLQWLHEKHIKKEHKFSQFIKYDHPLGEMYSPSPNQHRLEEGPGLGKTATSIGLDLIPIVGNGKSAIELFTGKDLVTGEDTSRWMSLVGIIPGLGNAAKGVKSGVKVVDATSDIMKVDKVNEVTKVTGNGTEMYRKIANTGAFKDLSEPMQLRHVDKIAKEAGIGLQGIKVQIIREPDLVGKGLYGWADPKGNKIFLYPDAFSSEENLVKTLGHERIHIYQTKTFGMPKDHQTLLEFEKGAYGSENSWWEYFIRKGR